MIYKRPYDYIAGPNRIAAWKRSLGIDKDHPILGVGPDAFITAYGHYLESDKLTGEFSRGVQRYVANRS